MIFTFVMIIIVSSMELRGGGPSLLPTYKCTHTHTHTRLAFITHTQTHTYTRARVYIHTRHTYIFIHRLDASCYFYYRSITDCEVCASDGYRYVTLLCNEMSSPDRSPARLTCIHIKYIYIFLVFFLVTCLYYSHSYVILYK